MAHCTLMITYADCSVHRVGVKPGLWTMDWTMDWTLDWTMDCAMKTIVGMITDRPL